MKCQCGCKVEDHELERDGCDPKLRCVKCRDCDDYEPMKKPAKKSWRYGGLLGEQSA